jgi:hypothetical protein
MMGVWSEDKSRFAETFMYSFGIATGYWLDGPGLLPGSATFFFSPQRPDRLWGPPALLYNGYWGPFPVGKMAGA